MCLRGTFITLHPTCLRDTILAACLIKPPDHLHVSRSTAYLLSSRSLYLYSSTSLLLQKTSRTQNHHTIKYLRIFRLTAYLISFRSPYHGITPSARLQPASISSYLHTPTHLRSAPRAPVLDIYMPPHPHTCSTSILSYLHVAKTAIRPETSRSSIPLQLHVCIPEAHLHTSIPLYLHAFIFQSLSIHI